MQKNKVVITDYEMLSAYGRGIENNWQKLLNGKTAINENVRFSCDNFISSYSATISDINYDFDKSLIMQMLEILIAIKKPIINNPDLLIVCSTVGEIDFLENSVLNGKAEEPEKSNINVLLKKAQKMFNAKRGMLFSAACASSSAGIAYAAELIKDGKFNSILVCGCDAVTEFVYSGFSALLALDSHPAKPFDKFRKGLTLGEGAAYLLLTSDDYAKQNKLPVKGFISGCGMSNDANHITGPSRDGNGLCRAIEKAFHSTSIDSSAIDSISAHGTGTVFNDSMEMKAFKSVFKNSVPTYSLKGGLGHTIGAAGLIEVIIAVKSLKENILPPTIGLIEADEEAKNWVYDKPISKKTEYCLSVNAGFGGINTAVIIKKNCRNR